MEEVTERQLVSFDWAMKKLLRSKANFVVLEGFLSELLFDDITILEVLESESNQEDEEDKYNRVDVKVKNGKGEIIIVEVQFNNEIDFFHRILFGVSKTICEHLNKGKGYSSVVKVISINILYFELGMGSDYIYRGSNVFKGMHDDSILKLNASQQEKFQKKLPHEIFPEYYILKVNNFNDVAKSPLDEWMYLFKHSAIKSDFKAKGIAEAAEVLNEMKMSKEERKAYERHIENLMHSKGIYETAIFEGFREGRAEGRAEGLKEGEQKGRVEGIKKLIEVLSELDFNNEQICEKIQKKFNITKEEADKFVNCFK